jgi:hypothetical protein
MCASYNHNYQGYKTKSLNRWYDKEHEHHVPPLQQELVDIKTLPQETFYPPNHMTSVPPGFTSQHLDAKHRYAAQHQTASIPVVTSAVPVTYSPSKMNEQKELVLSPTNEHKKYQDFTEMTKTCLFIYETRRKAMLLFGRILASFSRNISHDNLLIWKNGAGFNIITIAYDLNLVLDIKGDGTEEKIKNEMCRLRGLKRLSFAPEMFYGNSFIIVQNIHEVLKR